VLAEAHGCGLPAVAVRASGVDEVVQDGETGLLTKAEPRELADAAIGLLLDPERRRAMGGAARAIAERHFSAARRVDSMVGHYRCLLSGAR
jgi:glycosyltransferase involved in cell wall biosynthesis